MAAGSAMLRRGRELGEGVLNRTRFWRAVGLVSAAGLPGAAAGSSGAGLGGSGAGFGDVDA